MSIIKAQGSGEVSTGFYPFSIDQSLRYNSADTLAMKRTPSSAGNRQTWSISMWIKRGGLGINAFLCEAGASGNADSRLRLVFNTSDQLLITTGNANLVTSAMVLRDVSSFYHILWRNTGGTNTCFVNGVQATTVSISGDTAINSTVQHGFGTRGASGAGDEFDGYMAQYALFDGTAYTYDQVTETKDGILVPKNLSSLSYGTNGFLLDFANSGAVGTDAVGSNNMDTVSGFVASDVVPDTPTNNFNTTNVLSKGSFVTHSNGNLTVTGNTATNNGNYLAFPRLTSGKYYYEQYINIVSSYPYFIFNVSSDAFYSGNGGTTWPATANVRISAASGGGFTGLGASTGDIIGIAVDLDSGTKTVKIYKNNSLLETINITTSDAGIGMAEYNGSFSVYNFGQDSSFAGNETAQGNADGGGVGDFYYAPPSGYLALCSQNLPEPEIIDGSEYFNTVLYTGNSSTQSITGVGFSPDWTWIKQRNAAENHFLTDSVRGAGLHLRSDATTAESDTSATFTAFGADGFSLTGSGSAAPQINDDGDTYVAWNWLAGTAFSNSAGANGATIASSGQVNTTAGFSIVKYTGNATAGATVAHGLSSAPQFIITKNRDASTAWHVYYGDATDYLVLNTTAATADSAASGWNDVAPTSSVFSLGASNPSNANQDIAYCFHSVEGYSKVGSYTGNGNADGTFVFTGFRPAWILFKNTSTTTNWEIYDTTRQPSNAALGPIYANLSNAEESHATLPALDILSNGFKPRSTWAEFNTSGQTYIYLAIGSQPAKFSNAR